ncbi:TPA: hypothetical protein TXJ16_000674 [Streptococcus suis]|nr:hypothetical protein [Streptococcus suis]
MTKKIAKWEKDGFVLQSFQAGFAEKYYEDCFSKHSSEIDYLTGVRELIEKRMLSATTTGLSTTLTGLILC